MLFIFRVALPKNTACISACGTPEWSEGAKLSAFGAGLGVGQVFPPTGEGVGGLRGLLQENFSFENALRVDFRLSVVHI